MTEQVRFNEKELRELLDGPLGGVARDLARRAINVETAAKANLTLLGAVDSGRLRSSITWELGHDSTGLYADVGTNVVYGLYVEVGTGLYGPRHTVIFPRRARALSWVGRDGKRVFAFYVRGMRPRPYLRPALAAALA